MNNTVMMLVRETNVSSLSINEVENNGDDSKLNNAIILINVHIGLSSVFTINNINRDNLKKIIMYGKL